jgi:2-hydroxychromene-2-carboxylate isomerase
MEELEIDFYFSFRSPWSYLAVPRMHELQRDYNARVNLRVVDPIYIRYNEFFKLSHEKWMPYFFTDLMRSVEFLGMSFGAPRPDPINTELPADSTDHLVLMLSPMGIAAQALGHGVEFAREVSAIVWDGAIDGWDSGDHLSLAAQRAGLELGSVEDWIAANAQEWPLELAANNRALEEHHWGVPTTVFNGEPFFGQDKIEMLRWRLEQNGLQARS